MPEKTLDQLKQDIAVAATTGNDADFNALIKEYNSRKSDIAKALQEQARKEGEALAGVREKEIGRIGVAGKKMLKALYFDEATKTDNINKVLDELKATGLYLKYAIAEGISFGITVPVVKARSGGGGGNHITSKAEYGMTLDEIFSKFGTEKDKAKLKAAESNSGKWQVKNAVKKEALKAGLLKPTK